MGDKIPPKLSSSIHVVWPTVSDPFKTLTANLSNSVTKLLWNTEVVIHVQVNCTILPKVYVTKNAVLVFCISVSAKGFYKSQHVLDFVCETLQLSPHQLEDSRFSD